MKVDSFKLTGMKKSKYNLPPRWKVGRESNYTLKIPANQEWNGYTVTDFLVAEEGGRGQEGTTIGFYL